MMRLPGSLYNLPGGGRPDVCSWPHRVVSPPCSGPSAMGLSGHDIDRLAPSKMIPSETRYGSQ
jgi:hypothetical protein